LAKFFGEDKVGMFYSECKEFKEITVVVYPSYGKFLELYNGQFDTMIIDECDLFMSEDMRLRTIKTKAQFKYGLT
jgi:superfamily II DNA or RNA helicase